MCNRLAVHRLTAPLREGGSASAADVAIQFFILAPYVTYEALSKLWHGDQPETSWIGIALVTTSAIGMPLLGRAKRRLAHKLGSGATHGEGTQNMLCGYLAVAVLAGEARLYSAACGRLIIRVVMHR